MRDAAVALGVIGLVAGVVLLLGACTTLGDTIREMDGFGPNNTPYTTISDDPEEEGQDAQ